MKTRTGQALLTFQIVVGVLLFPAVRVLSSHSPTSVRSILLTPQSTPMTQPEITAETPPSPFGAQHSASDARPTISRIGSLVVSGSPSTVDVEGNIAYVAAGEGGLQIIDVSDPRNPIVRGKHACPGFCRVVQVINNRAYVSHYERKDNAPPVTGLQIVDVTVSARPVLLGSYSPGNSIFQVIGTLLYMADGNQLSIIDVSMPDRPVLLSKSPAIEYQITALRVVDKFAYVGAIGDRIGTVRIVDVQDPTNQLLRDRTGYLNNEPTTLTVADGIMYIIYSGGVSSTNRFTSLDFVDVRNPDELRRIGSYGASETETLTSVTVSGRYLYLGSVFYSTMPQTATLQLLDISTPASPVLLTSYDELRSIGIAEITGTRIYVPSEDAVHILEVDFPYNVWLPLIAR